MKAACRKNCAIRSLFSRMPFWADNIATFVLRGAWALRLELTFKRHGSCEDLWFASLMQKEPKKSH